MFSRLIKKLAPGADVVTKLSDSLGAVRLRAQVRAKDWINIARKCEYKYKDRDEEKQLTGYLP